MTPLETAAAHWCQARTDAESEAALAEMSDCLDALEAPDRPAECVP